MSVKRKFAALLMILVICMSVFTGCSLVTVNTKKYFEATVATITYTTGEKEKITKRDLISGYNSYGYNYVDSYGYTRKDAMKQTLETIINKRITIKAVENYYEENPTEGDMLNGNETTYIWDTTYDAIYKNLKDYLNDVLGITTPESSDDSADSNASVFSPYVKTAYLVEDGGKYTIKKTTPATTIRETYKGRQDANDVFVDFEYKNSENSYVFKEDMYTKLYSLADSDTSTSAKNWKSAFNKYIADIKSNYNYKKFDSDKECFMFELDRVYNILKDNYIVEKYEVIYNRQSHQGADTANVKADDILKYYSAKVRADYTSYVIEGGESSFASSMLSDVGSVDYILEGNNTSKYFYVGSVKIEMTAKQKADYSKLKTDLANQNIGYNKYEEEVDKIYSSLYATRRDATTGEKTVETVASQVLLNKINQAVANYKYITVESYIKDLPADEKNQLQQEATAKGVTLEQYVEVIVNNYNKNISYQKADAFRTYLYLYNDDESLKGADYNAVFGIDSSNAVLASSTFSENEDVKDAILALFNNGKAKIGDTTEFVRTDDGIYMFFYAGRIENLFSGITVNFDASTQTQNIKTLTSTRLNIFSEKTVFDKIYSELTTDNFSVFQNMNMNYLRESLTKKIESIENNLKDLY